MVHIKPLTKLRNDYASIADLAHKTGDAVYITRNGKAILVVMSLEAFEQRDLLMKLGTIVLEGERSRFEENSGYNLNDVFTLLEREGYCC